MIALCCIGIFVGGIGFGWALWDIRDWRRPVIDSLRQELDYTKAVLAQYELEKAEEIEARQRECQEEV